MHFERNLKRTIYAPWRDQYIDYQKLKQLLRDEGSDAGSAIVVQGDKNEWTEEDESAFVQELVNVQLEKVNKFHSETVEKLRERTSVCESRLADVVAGGDKKDKGQDGQEQPQEVDDPKREFSDTEKAAMREVLDELDGITKEMNELERFSRINYTGFMKAAKKHDRKRGAAYRVRPLMQVRLAELPFNKEDYSPLLFRINTMYTFARQRLDITGPAGRKASELSIPEPLTGSERFHSFKFWVHPENVLELRTVIIRRLPVLVYNPQTSKIADGLQPDPTITSIYFDNPKFSLYNEKVAHADEARSLRIRWHDQLSEATEVFVEKKTVYEDDTSKEQKLNLKPKHVEAFLAGSYKLDKEVARLTEIFGEESQQVNNLKENIADIQEFVSKEELQPMLRANYTRTAFQIPRDDRVRITLDTDLALIREDALDAERPCRDPEDWHRRDIDDQNLEFPFTQIRKGEINRFPFALLEIRIKGNKKYEWVNEIMNSHLVKIEPRFSKFAHGIAQNFEDYVNTFPFWLSEIDTDIRKDPHQAFEEEQERRSKAAEDELAVGSLLSSRTGGGFSRKIVSPIGSPSPRGTLARKGMTERASAATTRRSASELKSGRNETVDEEDSEDGEIVTAPSGLRSFIPTLTRYGQSRRHGQVKLPPGVNEPTFWIKNEGPNKVEAKVWLANQRTYIKWQHVGILLASLSLGLYNAAGQHNQIAQSIAVVYTLLGVFTAIWGYLLYIKRSRMIQERSGKDFDALLGPVVVCTGLIVALLLNFGFKWSQIMERRRERTTVFSMGSNTSSFHGIEDL